MAAFSRQQLKHHLPLVGGGLAGGLAAAGGLLAPVAWLGAAVAISGLGDVLPAAQPPLGLTARALLALGGGGLLAAVVWAAMYLLWGPGGPLAARTRNPHAKVSVRRADRHPDAPPRRPLSIAELSAPVVVETPPAVAAEARPLPADLEMPLAAFDPAAILPVPREPAQPVAALAPGERFETFALSPRRLRPVSPAETPSIEALLRRLEQGAERRVARTG